MNGKIERMEKHFVILYTHQKQKKAKTWHDGVLKHNGTGTKAVLYDEKGCRLDSIHIKVDDITVGEQLESDRYYILVEEIKDMNKIQHATVSDVVCSQPQQPAHQTFSQARCAGLKRKNSGFMPPRMIKQPCLGTSYDSPSDYDACSRLPQSVVHIDTCQNHNEMRVPPLPNQVRNLNRENVPFTNSSLEPKISLQQSCPPLNHIGRNMLSMYSRFGKAGNGTDSENSSQDSFGCGENTKLLSPWSVYGSKNSSPSLSEGMPRPEPSSNNCTLSTVKGTSNTESTGDKQFVSCDVSIYRQPETNVPYSSDNEYDYSGARTLHGNEDQTQKHVFQNVQDSKEQSKRNLTQIMKLLKKKPVSENVFQDSIKKYTCQNGEISRYKLNNANEAASVEADHKQIKAPCIKNIIPIENDQNSEENVSEAKDLKSETCQWKSVEGKYKTGNEECLNSAQADIDIGDQKVAEGSGDKFATDNTEYFNKQNDFIENNEDTCEDEDLIGSFHINFSPLSHVTDTDDENELPLSENKVQNCSDAVTAKDNHKVNDLQIDENKDSEQICSNDQKREDCFRVEAVEKVSADINYQKQKPDECELGSSILLPCPSTKVNVVDICDGSRELNNSQAVSSKNVESNQESTKNEVTGLETKIDLLDDIDIAENVKEMPQHMAEDTIPDNSENSYESISNDQGTSKYQTYSDGTLVTSIAGDSRVEKSSSIQINETENKTDFGNPETRFTLSQISGVDDHCIHMVKNDTDNLKTGCFDLCGDDLEVTGNEYETDTVMDAGQYIDASQGFADNSEGLCSRTTSMSQDTMDFSCNTLGDDSQNYSDIANAQLRNPVSASNIRNTNNNLDKTDNNVNMTNSENENKSCLVNSSLSNTGFSDINYESVFISKEPNITNYDMSLAMHKEQLYSTGSVFLSQHPERQIKSSDMTQSNLQFNASAIYPNTDYHNGDTEDPLGDLSLSQVVPPHPNELFHRKRTGKAKRGNTNDVDQQQHLLTSVNTGLGRYGRGGISSAVVSRSYHNSKLRQAEGAYHSNITARQAPSPCGTTYHTNPNMFSPSVDQLVDRQYSPFQRLSDSDLSAKSSPSFYIDWKSNKPQIVTTEKMSEDNPSLWFKPDSDSQDPTHQRQGLTSQTTDEEDIYKQLYRPRLMYHQNQLDKEPNWNYSNISPIADGEPNNQAIGHEHNNQAIGHEYIKQARGHKNTNQARGHKNTIHAKSHENISQTRFYEHISQARGHETIDLTRGHEHASQSRGQEIADGLIELGTNWGDGKKVQTFNRSVNLGQNYWNHAIQNFDNMISMSAEEHKVNLSERNVTSGHAMYNVVDSPVSVDSKHSLVSPPDSTGHCSVQTRQSYFQNAKTYDSQSSEEYFRQEETHSPRTGSFSKCRVDSEMDTCDKIAIQNETRVAPTAESPCMNGQSKWQHYVASQASDDCDIDLSNLTKKIESVQKCKKDFIVLKNSPGLYNTQKIVYQNVRDSGSPPKSLVQTLTDGLNSQQSFNLCNSSSYKKYCEGSSSSRNIELSCNMPEEHFKTSGVKFQLDDSDKTGNTDKYIGQKITNDSVSEEKVDCSFPETFSSMDSFEQLLADNDFNTGAMPGNIQNQIIEQQVPESGACTNGNIHIISEDGKTGENTEHVADIITDDKFLDKHSSESCKHITVSEDWNTEETVKGESMKQETTNVTIDTLALDNYSSGEMEHMIAERGDISQEAKHSTKFHDDIETLGIVKHCVQKVLVCQYESVCNEVHNKCVVKENSANCDAAGSLINDTIDLNHKEDVEALTIDEKELKHNTEDDFSDFSAGESFDLSLSLDSKVVNTVECEPSNNITDCKRIGWQPPVKVGNKINSGQSVNNPGILSQLTASRSEKVKPTFKCLRLLAQSKAVVSSECNINRETNTRVDAALPPLSTQTTETVPDYKNKQKWTFSPSLTSSPNLSHDSDASVANTEVNYSQDTDKENIKEMKGSRQSNQSSQQKRFNPPAFQSGSVPNKGFKPPTVLRAPVSNKLLPAPGQTVRNFVHKKVSPTQGVSQTELMFPGRSETESTPCVLRQVVIPESFPSVGVYKHVLTAALTEYLNTQLFDVAKRFHHALSTVDISGYSEAKSKKQGSGVSNSNPHCQCGVASKMVCVKKEGPNCGRYFYACSAGKKQQCKFFQWADEARRGCVTPGSKRKIHDVHSLGVYMKEQRVQFYGESQLIKRTKENIKKYFKAHKWVRGRGEGEVTQKKQVLLKLPHKGRSSLYAKDDIWVISRHVDFDPLQTFLARSTYYGPSSTLEVEIEPITGYSPSNWQNGDICHAILVGNASTELSCMDNIREHIQTQSLPVLPHLLNRGNTGSDTDTDRTKPCSKGFQAPRVLTGEQSSRNVHIHTEQMDGLCRQYIERYRLNIDQAEAMKRIANMFSVEKSTQVDSVLLIHGVFGAGKSFLLSIMVLFLVEVFQLNDSLSSGQPFPWKLLISSTTNVAVDRILTGLLDLGFEEFIRVGSMKKIAKPVLPHSVHASGTDSQELKDLQEMLRSGELTNSEKSQVRQSIEKHRLGENKKKLGRVRVVGATCASCSLTCLNNMEFPLVLLDECSQMTESTSLLTLARFGCQKLLLVGDPKQLDPTIQGAEAAHRLGLEQTMFDRLVKMGSVPTLLRTQYRCHPYISSVANKLFYGGMLEDGVAEYDRKPLLEILPTLCFFDVERGEENSEGAGSYFNEREAQFVVFLLQVLLSSEVEPSHVGVVTLYRSQVARITDLLTAGHVNNTEMKGIQVSTVDAFQGGERDIIILSTVRSDACGFIDNDKRMNVALTRAKHHLLIVGNRNNLSRNMLWAKVINHCRSYPNGIQSADEARHNLEKYMESVRSCETSQSNHDNKPVNSQGSISSIPVHSRVSISSEKQDRKRKARRKRKLAPDEICARQATASLEDECINSPTKASTAPSIESIVGDFSDDDFMMEELDSNIPEFRPDSGEPGSGNSRPMSLSGHRDLVDCDQLSKGIVNNPSQQLILQRKKHATRLQPLMFNSDEENAAEEDLPVFNCE